MFRFTPIALSLALVACGGGGSPSIIGDNKTPDAPAPTVITNTDDSLTIVGNSQLQTVDKSKSATVTITGNSNDVVIKSNVTTLTINGDSNDIDVASGVIISNCSVTGNSNKLTKADTQPINCQIKGSSNKGFD
jgi:hypothetical protein